MFCGECGTKNRKDSQFCENCGAKLVEEKPTKQTKKVSNSKQVNNESFGTKLKKMPMQKKILLGVGLAVIVAFITAFAVMNNKFSPKAIAKDYFLAVVNADIDKLYQYSDVEKSEFTSKKLFKKFAEDSLDDGVKISNYKIGKVEKSNDGLTAIISISYVEEGEDEPETVKVTLIKQKSKKYLFFDNWKISNNMSVLNTKKDYQVKVLKDTKVTIEGIDVDKKYIDEDASDENYDVYKMPAMFTERYSIKLALPLGFEIEDKMNVSGYSSYSFQLDKDNLPDDIKNKIIETTKVGLQTLYNGAKDKKSFDEVKKAFEFTNANLEDLKETYEDLVEDLADSELTSIEFTEISLNSFYSTSDGYKAYIKAKYNYTVTYSYGDEVKTHDSNSSDTMDIYYSYSDNAFKMTDATSLITYFSRYY